MNRRELRGSHRYLLLGSAQRKWEKWRDPLIGVAPSASTVSRLNQTLTEQFEAWRQRPLQAHWRILYLDGVHFTVRHGDQTDPTIILTALGVDREGNKEALARLSVCRRE
jgi:transposase-like protein